MSTSKSEDLDAGPESSFRIAANGVEIEMSGSQDFVSEQIENLSGQIADLIERGDSPNPSSDHQQVTDPSTPEESDTEPEIADSATPPSNSSTDGEPAVEDFEHVIHVDRESGQIDLICELPGDSNADKVRNATLLSLLGAELAQDEKMKAKELRRICDVIGIRGSNFSHNYKSISPNKILITPPEGSKNPDLKLTHQGKMEALSLAEELEKSNREEFSEVGY